MLEAPRSNNSEFRETEKEGGWRIVTCQFRGDNVLLITTAATFVSPFDHDRPNQDVPDYSIVVGNPARVLREIEPIALPPWAFHR